MQQIRPRTIQVTEEEIPVVTRLGFRVRDNKTISPVNQAQLWLIQQHLPVHAGREA